MKAPFIKRIILSCIFFVCFISFLIFGCATNKNYYANVPLDRIRLIKNDTLYQFYTLPIKEEKIHIARDKYYTWFLNDTVLSTRGAYYGKMLNGEYIELFPNQSLKKKGNYDRGLKDGVWKTWFSNGELESEYKWDNGERNGAFQEFNREGKLIRRGKFKNNMREGEVIDSLQNGSTRLTIYKKGIITKDTVIAPSLKN